jgi:two-component system, NtrC family, sensor kinase
VRLRTRALLATVVLVLLTFAGAAVIVGNLRYLVANQELIVFKDQTFHEQERARDLLQSAQSRLYQHQAGYTRDIDHLIDDIATFETIITSIVPHYREHVREDDCSACHEDGQRKIEGLEETMRGILANLARYRESVSVIITTNDRDTRVLQNGIANARGEEMLATIQRVNAKAERMVRQLREKNELLLRRSERSIQAAVGAISALFILTLCYLLWEIGRLVTGLLRGTESVTRDDFSHRIPLAARSDEVGLLAGRFNLMAEHLEERDRQIRQKTAEIETANRRLFELNETLEEKVQERTHDLQSSLEQLRRAGAALEDSRRRLESANQELLRSNQAKANFLSIISHELKTPLSVINGFLSLILDERYENDAQHLREAVQIAKRRGEQLARMIDELIDLSRLDARSMVLRREPTDVAALFRELGAEFAEEFRRRGLRFSLRLPPQLPLLNCDPGKLRQVFTNLIANALKFSPEGGEIELGAEDRGPELLLSCRDTGIGIPDAERERVFDKFYQVDSSATRRFGGAGLGLSIVKEIVLLHGGQTWVESTPGHGSIFFVVLPKNPPPEAAGGAPQPPEAAPA